MSIDSPIVFASMLWKTNKASKPFSSMYNEEWVEKLYRGFERNTKRPFEFHLWVDDDYEFNVPVITHKITAGSPDYSCFIQPFELNRPMILVGLDTVIVGNLDAMIDYCFTGSKVALPDDPYMISRICNGVALVPAGNSWVYDKHQGENDMVYLRGIDYARLDGLFSGSCASYKVDVKRNQGLGDARIVYFHGVEKPHELNHVRWIGENWV